MPRRPAHRLTLPTPGRQAVGAVLLVLGWGLAAAAAPLAVAEPADGSEEGQATAAVLRSLLDDGRGAVVSGAEVRKLGPRTDVAAALSRLSAGAVLSIEVRRGDDGLAAWYRLDSADGRLVEGRAEAAPGDVHMLALRIARAVASRADLTPREEAAAGASLGELRPFARAAAALDRGERASAAAALALADAGVARSLGGARDVAQSLLADTSQPLATRLRAARLGGDLAAGLALGGGGARDVAARAERVRLLVAAGDLDEAEAELARARRAASVDLAMARAELIRGRGGAGAPRAVALVLRPYLERRRPDPEVLSFAAHLPPRFLEPRDEAALLETARRAAPFAPEVAALVAVRAARGGLLAGPAAQLVRVEDLASADLVAVDKAARVLDGAGALLRGRIAARQAIAERLDPLPAGGGAGGSADSPPQTRAGAALVAAGPLRVPGEGGGGASPSVAGGARAGGPAPEASTTVPLNQGPAPRAAATAVNLGDRAAGPVEPLRAVPVDLSAPEMAQAGASLSPLLAAFPDLADRRPRDVLVVEQRSAWSPLLRTHEIVASQVEAGLRHALASAPYHLRTVTSDGPPLEGLKAASLRELVAQRSPQSEAVLLWKADTSGSDAVIDLTLYDVVLNSARQHVEVVDGSAAGLTRWNRTLLGALGGLALLVALMALYFLVLTGEAEVDIIPDGGIDRQTLAVRLSRSSRRPSIDGPDFERRHGNTRVVGRRLHIGPDRKVRFRYVAPGSWHVHVYGVVVRGGQLRALTDDFSRKITVDRGRTAFVAFDLKVSIAEYQVVVMDGEPRPDTPVWVDELRHQSVFTDGSGAATVRVPMGAHVLRADAGDIIAEKRINVTSSRAMRVTIDVAFERRVARIEIAEEDPIPMPPTSRLGLRPAPTLGTPAALAHPGWPGGGPPGLDIALADVGDAIATGDRGAGQRSATRAIGVVDLDEARRAPTAVEQAAAAAAAAPELAPRGPASAFGAGRYQVVARLGAGAMGVVYRARDSVLDREVAIKVVGDDARRHAGVLQMFLQEAKAMAALNHPNLVTVFDQGQDGGNAFMVMELIEGSSLEQVLERRGRLPWREVVALGDQLCAGLAYAHERRILHRDIKPANIFVSSRQVVKIGDFGLARAVERLRVTQTKVCGSPAYMAPEQIRGTDLDFRSDLYSLGCTLFEMLTGRVPFIEGEPMYHHMYTPPPDPATIEPSVPEPIALVVLSCLAKDKDARVPSAAALAEQLRAAAAASG